jgi:hypothetical protein
MLEITTTFTRPNLGKDFFVFQTDDIVLLKANTNFRKEMSDAPGFIGMSYFLSEDKLKLRIQLLWETELARADFIKSSNSVKLFNNCVMNYNTSNGVIAESNESLVMDPKYLKDKKLSTRLTVKEAQNRLLDFLNQ